MSSKEITFLFKHSTIYGLGTVLGQLVGFIMLPIYTRYLTPKDYGVLHLIEISTLLLGMVITTGIAQTLSRFYFDHEEKHKKNKTVSTVYITYCIIALIVSPFLYLSVPILSTKVLDSPVYTTYFYISFLSFIFGGMLDIGLTYLRIINKSGYFVIISVSRLVMLLSLNIYFIVFKGLGVLGILYSTLITRIFFQMVLTLPILFKIKIRFSFRYCIEMLTFSLPLIPARLARTFVQQSDRYFIRYFISISNTGIYSLAQKLGTAVHLIITASFQAAFEPRRYEIAKRPDAKDTFNKIFCYHAMVMVFVGLGISVFVPEILRLMVTPKFYPAGKLIPLIVFSMILFGFRKHFEFGILWSKKTKYYTYTNSIIAVLNLILNLVFIPTLGLYGAVYSSTLCIIIHNMLVYIFGQKDYFIKFDFLRVAKLFALAFPIYGISLLINADLFITNIILKCLLMIAFIILLLPMKIITKEEASMVKAYYRQRIKVKPISTQFIK